MDELTLKYREIIVKYKFLKKEKELFRFLINEFPEDSLFVEKNFKEDSSMRLAFEEFKSISG